MQEEAGLEAVVGWWFALLSVPGRVPVPEQAAVGSRVGYAHIVGYSAAGMGVHKLVAATPQPLGGVADPVVARWS